MFIQICFSEGCKSNQYVSHLHKERSLIFICTISLIQKPLSTEGFTIFLWRFSWLLNIISSFWKSIIHNCHLDISWTKIIYNVHLVCCVCLLFYRGSFFLACKLTRLYLYGRLQCCELEVERISTLTKLLSSRSTITFTDLTQTYPN